MWPDVVCFGDSLVSTFLVLWLFVGVLVLFDIAGDEIEYDTFYKIRSHLIAIET